MLDRFHVVQLLNQNWDAFRRRLRQETPDEAGYKQLKWLLFKQYHRLTGTELDTLQAAFAVNAELKTAYFLREEFHHILDRPQAVDSATGLLDKWIERIETQKVTRFDSFIRL